MKITVCTALLLIIIAASANARPMRVGQSTISRSNFVFNVPTLKSFHGRTDKPDKTALKFVQDKFGLAAADVVVKNIVPSDATGITSVYLRQKVNSIEVTNSDINVNVDKKGSIVSYGENIFRGARPSQPSLSKKLSGIRLTKAAVNGFKTLAAFLKLPLNKVPLRIRQSGQSIEKAAHNNRPAYFIRKLANVKADVPVRFSYIQTNNGSRLKLVCSYQLQLKDHWYHGHVSTDSGRIVLLTDWVSDASYKVLDINIADPLEANPTVIKASTNMKASPYGWHSNGISSYHDTRGNNVWAQENTHESKKITNLYRPNGGSRLEFRFSFDQTQDPTNYKDAAITQLFYTTNVLHDMLYQYGFDESSGNFQDNNGKNGGKEHDFVIVNAQDQKGTNNANFATPSDGQSGVMNMYLWDQTSPKRDGIFDTGIVIHEYGHGLSNRLTGGPANSDCLSTTESGGLGEGWSDVLAVVFRQKPKNKRTDTFPIGAYASGANGIRNFPYSTDMTVNPSLFSYIDKPDYDGVHAIGEVWAVILLEVYWNLVDNLGFTPDLYSAYKFKGNTLFLHLMLNGMKLQPCDPTFIQARDAFIQAEAAITKGKHKCQLWKGFAKRGLGYDASGVHGKAVDGFQLAPGC